MIDPFNVTNYNRSQAELEEFWLFCLCVAGKTASTQAKNLDLFLKSCASDGKSPFEILQTLVDDDDLMPMLKLSRLGQYKKLHRAFTESLTLDLKTSTVDDLEKIHGVGLKTSRFFLLHSRKNARIAALDTHIMKHLNANGILVKGNITPSSKKEYLKLEQEFLKLADLAGKIPADYDLEIWTKYSKSTK